MAKIKEFFYFEVSYTIKVTDKTVASIWYETSKKIIPQNEILEKLPYFHQYALIFVDNVVYGY